jgi:N-acetylmuramoyl-L-alanine amidase
MKIRSYISMFWPLYLLIATLFLCLTSAGSRTVEVIAKEHAFQRFHHVVIDAGHGGIDGGATSVSGVSESQINLQIALRLNDLMHFMGYETVMIRTTDTSVYTAGETIAQKKVSDLKERVRVVNQTENALLVSIHQNTFQDGKYSGAQVFYADSENSRVLAEQMQQAFCSSINPGSNRKCKPSDGIYLMQQIRCPGILVECGFISNHREEAMLREESYQKKICCVIAATVSSYLDLQTND